ncbi:MAG: hypothetical protein Q8M76_17385, partial [Spirochaetaceae bacterium]|nr:hypothetical protein [Spirochaetaceae bacterium]
MLNTRLKKAVGDLWANRARSLLVLVAIIVGVVGVGIVLDSGAILSREMSKNYLATNPASAIFTIGGKDEAALALA